MPDSYVGKTVLVIGMGASGVDIAFDVGQVANKVIKKFNLKFVKF